MSGSQAPPNARTQQGHRCHTHAHTHEADRHHTDGDKTQLVAYRGLSYFACCIKCVHRDAGSEMSEIDQEKQQPWSHTTTAATRPLHTPPRLHTPNFSHNHYFKVTKKTCPQTFTLANSSVTGLPSTITPFLQTPPPHPRNIENNFSSFSSEAIFATECNFFF